MSVFGKRIVSKITSPPTRLPNPYAIDFGPWSSAFQNGAYVGWNECASKYEPIVKALEAELEALRNDAADGDE